MLSKVNISLSDRRGRMAADPLGELAEASAPVRVNSVHRAFGAVPVLDDIDLEVTAGSILVLLGPSGCGKTTLLRVLAGLEQADAGSVHIGDDLVTGPGVHIPPEKRRVGLVFQDWALFPHLSVTHNIGYGLERGDRKSGRVEEIMELVGLGGLDDRSPGQLSGGQQQRVALARALAPAPRVLLLDEPFSNLDLHLRVDLRLEVRRLLTELGPTAIFVTPDQDEAFTLGDQAAVMNAGRIVQQAPPDDPYRAPASPWAARSVGDANIVEGAGLGASAETIVGTIPLRHEATGDHQVLVRPEHLDLTFDGPGVVSLVEYFGHDTLYRVDLGDTELSIRAPSAPVHANGDRVSLTYSGPPTTSWPRSSAPAPPTP